MWMKNSNDTIRNRTCDLLACSMVPQPTAPPHASFSPQDLQNKITSFGITVKRQELYAFFQLCWNHIICNSQKHLNLILEQKEQFYTRFQDFKKSGLSFNHFSYLFSICIAEAPYYRPTKWRFSMCIQFEGYFKDSSLLDLPRIMSHKKSLPAFKDTQFSWLQYIAAHVYKANVLQSEGYEVSDEIQNNRQSCRELALFFRFFHCAWHWVSCSWGVVPSVASAFFVTGEIKFLCLR